ncbi:zinc finger protein Noc-like [Pollicipes pollicipes]|uniref:zinc finger protein Noc-like n=1 Tax=Pollicipes pollicipes TaxID=41117 RepID=UPI00188542E6|nr:zinc finger protein Noc-like [Pollicipes pollicipes]
MLTNGTHSYIQPDPFSPVHSAMDSKSSPLAMLQKTCSQIGADTIAAKPPPPPPPPDKKKEETRKESPVAERPAFKPYELESRAEEQASDPEPATDRDRRSPPRSPDSRKTPKSEASSTTSPVSRPGAEVLAGCSGARHHRPGDKCQSPYCPCAFSTPHGYGAPCPAGCAPCEHAKALGGALGSAQLHSPYLALGSPFYPPLAAAGAGVAPVVCSWMADGRYCGKRFASTEELMQHLRSHTSLSPAEAVHRSPFAPAPLSPLSAARYHPYSKPASLALAAAAQPGSLAGAYYAPYSALYARPPALP